MTGGALRLIREETLARFKEKLRYPAALITTVLMLATLYGASLLLGGDAAGGDIAGAGDQVGREAGGYLVFSGALVWALAISASMRATHFVGAKGDVPMFEIALLSRHSMTYLTLVRAIPSTLYAVISTFAILALYRFANGLAPSGAGESALMLVRLALIDIAAFAFGLVLAGLSLRYRKTGPVVALVALWIGIMLVWLGRAETLPTGAAALPIVGPAGQVMWNLPPRLDQIALQAAAVAILFGVCLVAFRALIAASRRTGSSFIE